MAQYDLQLTFDWSRLPKTGNGILQHTLLKEVDGKMITVDTSSGSHTFEAGDHARVVVFDKQGLVQDHIARSLTFDFAKKAGNDIGGKSPFLHHGEKDEITFPLVHQDSAWVISGANAGATVSQNVAKGKEHPDQPAWNFDISVVVSGPDPKGSGKLIERTFVWDPEMIVDIYPAS